MLAMYGSAVSRRKVQTSVYLDEELLEQLREESRRSNVPMAVMIRIAVENFLDKSLKLTPRVG